MNEQDQIANAAFQLMQVMYPTEFKHCVAEARAQIAEARVKELEDSQQPEPQNGTVASATEPEIEPAEEKVQ